MNHSKRALLQGIGSGALAATALPGITSALSTEEIPGVRVEEAPNSKQNVLAFTALDQATFVLSIANGTTSAENSASDIIQVTTRDGAQFETSGGNRLMNFGSGRMGR